MDVTKILEPAEKLFEFDINEYVKLKLFPLEARYQIEKAKTAGIDVVKLAGLLNENKMLGMSEDKMINAVAANEKFKTVLLPEFNGGIEYKILACLFGIDQADHSFIQDEKNFRLDRSFWENLLAKDQKTFDKIQKAVEIFQTDYSLEIILSEVDPESGEVSGNV